MLRNSHNSRGLSANGGNPLSRWRTVFMALVLALSMGSVNQIQPAQAAPAGATELRFFMIATVQGASMGLCKGELATVQVLVYRLKVINGVAESPDTVTGVTVNGWANNPDVGQISPRTNTTIRDSTIYDGAADFIFTANNYGETTINFEATVATPGWFGTDWGGGSKTVSASVDVRVVPCKFMVTLIGNYEYDVDQHYTSQAVMEAELKGDELGNFKGSALMYVMSQDIVPGCVATVPTIAIPVNLTGSLDNTGQVEVKLSFEPTAISENEECSGESGSGQSIASVSPFGFKTPLNGGTFTIPSKYETWTSIPGIATIIIVPEKGQVAAFNVGNHEARIGSPFSWLWGDYFPGLYGALLALR